MAFILDDSEEEGKEEYVEILDEADDVEEYDGEDVPVFVQSRKGKTILQFNGHRYRKAYKSKTGVRWVCSVNKQCNAFVYLNDDDEIIMSNQEHSHSGARVDKFDLDQDDTAIVITSRKGREMLLFRQYTYRQQYVKGDKARWVCSTMKNCRSCVFTDSDNYIISTSEQHCHPPPKYYLKRDNVMGALRQPFLYETQ
nr:uncharacterized protein LOC128672688 [Plodia interpunctella]